MSKLIFPSVILLIGCHLINGQFYFAFEVPDDSRIPQSNLFDVNSFKYVPPSQLSRSFAASLPRAASTSPQQSPPQPSERRQSRSRSVEPSSGLQSSAQNNVFLRASPVPQDSSFASSFGQPQSQQAAPGQPQLFQVPPDSRFRLASTADQLQTQPQFQSQPSSLSSAPTFSSLISDQHQHQHQQPSGQRFPTSLGQLGQQQPQPQVFTSEGPDFKHTLTTNFVLPPSPSQPPPTPTFSSDPNPQPPLRSSGIRQPQIISQGAPADQTFSPGPPPFTEPSAHQQPPQPGPFESFFRSQQPQQLAPQSNPQFSSAQFLPPQPQMLPRTQPPSQPQFSQPQFQSQPPPTQLSQPQQPQISQGLTPAQIAALNFFNGAPNPRAFEHVRARFEAQQRAQQEAQLRAQQEAQSRAQQAQSQAQRDAEERARAEAQARSNAEARAKLEAQIRAQHEAQARANQEAQARAHELVRQRSAQEAAQREAQSAPGQPQFNSRQQQPSIQTLPRTQFQSSPDLSSQQFQPQPQPLPQQPQFQPQPLPQQQFQQPQPQQQFQQPQPQPQLIPEQFSGFDQFGQPIGGGDILRQSAGGRTQQQQPQAHQHPQPHQHSFSQPQNFQQSSFQSAPSQPTFQSQPQPSLRQSSALSFSDQRTAIGSQIEQPRPQATTARPQLSNPSSNSRSNSPLSQPRASASNQPNWAPAKLAIAQLPADTDDDGIPGLAGKDYPTLMSIPETSFSCKNQPLSGYYADTETACQVVHFCQTGGVQDSFLCPNGTIFNQEKFSCQWWYEVNCADAPRFYVLNDNLYRVPGQNTPAPSSSGSSSSSRSSPGKK